MAQYRCRIRTAKSVPDAFTFMSDVCNFQEWDPGVVSVQQIAGDGPGPDAVYDVLTKNGGRELVFRYRVTAFDSPVSYTIVGKKTPFTSTDMIAVEPDADGTVVTYAAELAMPFPLSLADRRLQGRFDQIGDAAAEGLAFALDGTWLR
ncbi:MAG: SRPBCC family protein [Acidimicrobiia bacterium]